MQIEILNTIKNLNEVNVGKSCGKCILVGEHSAIYGFPALSFPLKKVGLTSQLIKPRQEKKLDSFFNVILKNKHSQKFEYSKLNANQFHELNLAFEMALNFVYFETLTEQSSFGEQLFYILKDKGFSVEIISEIPLGAGMGGSAALCVSFIRLAEQILQKKCSNTSTCANEIEMIFHGKSSGLDVATCSANTLILFNSLEKTSTPIKCSIPLYFVLQDSGIRTPTKILVEKVSQNIDKNKPFLNELGNLTALAQAHIEQGKLKELAFCLNLAENLLEKIGVSYIENTHTCKQLLNTGAMAAKVTGAGGGGLCLGLFEVREKALEYAMKNKDKCWFIEV
jgi:mevalonate kinase